MMQSFVTVLTLVVALSVIGCTRGLETPYLCEPALFDTRTNHIKRLCVALENTNHLTNEINTLLNSQEPSYRNYDQLLSEDAINQKRSDVDHLFLRFGRRSNI